MPRNAIFLIFIILFLAKQAAAQTIDALVDRTVIPEGSTATILIKASNLSDPVTVNLLPDPKNRVALSSSSVTLTGGKPEASIALFIADDTTKQTNQDAFMVTLSSSPIQTNPTEFSFIIPPNDLTVTSGRFVALTQSVTGTASVFTVRGEFIVEGLKATKTFSVSSLDSRVVVRSGIITTDKDSFTVDLDFTESGEPSKGNSLAFKVSHLDAFMRRSNRIITQDVSTTQDASTTQDVSTQISIAQLSAGDSYSCAIRVDGMIVCWGSDSNNQSSPTSSKPNQGGPIGENDRFLAVSAGNFHACGIKEDNTMACWGQQLNEKTDPTKSIHGNVNRNTKFLAVSAGGEHTCGIKEDSTMACWTVGKQSQPNSSRDSQGGPVRENDKFLAVSAGNSHTCGIRIDGTMACWGVLYEQRTNPTQSIQQNVNRDTKFLAVSAGGEHTCAIKENRTVACWGSNGDINNPDGRSSPTSSRLDQRGDVSVDQNTKFLAVSAGGEHTCGIRTDGTMACWGNSADGQTNHQDGKFLAVSAGKGHTCGIRTDGTVTCWGNQDTVYVRGENRRIDVLPPTNFERAQTIQDVFYLAEKSDEISVALEGILTVSVNSTELNVVEGSTAPLTIGVEGLTEHATVTLTVDEGAITLGDDELSSLELVLDAKTTQRTVSVMADDDDDYAPADPAVIALRVTGNFTLPPSLSAISVTIINNDLYAIAFDPPMVEVSEGSSGTAVLSISPAPDMPTTVTLSTNNEQLMLNQYEFTFTSVSTMLDLVVTAVDDMMREGRLIYTVTITPDADLNKDLYRLGGRLSPCPCRLDLLCRCP